MEWIHNEYLISTDRSKIDVDAVHHFLTRSYWAEGIAKDVVERSINNSLCFGLYHRERLAGFARVVSDYATFAYLADVFIIPEERGRGLSKWLIKVIIEHPQLQGLRRFTLATRDAHDLYTKFGFNLLDKPERWMHRNDPDVYKKG